MRISDWSSDVCSSDLDIKPGTLVGRYRHTPAAITMTIATQGDGTALLTLSNPLGAIDYALAAIGPALWEARATGNLPMAVLLEARDDGLLLTNGRTRRLWFERLSCCCAATCCDMDRIEAFDIYSRRPSAARFSAFSRTSPSSTTIFTRFVP